MLDIKVLVGAAKAKHINDPRMIASWIYNKCDGKKFYTVKQLKELVNDCYNL